MQSKAFLVTTHNTSLESAVADGASTGADLFAIQGLVAVEYGGALHDSTDVPPAGASVSPITASSPQGLEILRHSAAHVLAQAVQSINPQAKLGIGPPVTDGFYYDFDVEVPFAPEDLSALEKEMQRIVKSGQRFQRRVVSADQAREELKKDRKSVV